MKEIKKLYGYYGWKENFWSFSTERQDNDTHELEVQPCMLKEICQHKNTRMWEPHLAGARKCNDCGWEYNPNMTPKWHPEPCKHKPKFTSIQIHQGLSGELKAIDFNWVECEKCGIKIEPVWSEKK